MDHSPSNQSHYHEGLLNESHSASLLEVADKYSVSGPQTPIIERNKAVEEEQFTGSLKDLIKVRRHFINLLILLY